MVTGSGMGSLNHTHVRSEFFSAVWYSIRCKLFWLIYKIGHQHIELQFDFLGIHVFYVARVVTKFDFNEQRTGGGNNLTLLLAES